MKDLGPYDVSVGAQERISQFSGPIVVMYLPVDVNGRYQMEPSVARSLSRHLAKYVGFIDPPKKKPVRKGA